MRAPRSIWDEVFLFLTFHAPDTLIRALKLCGQGNEAGKLMKETRSQFVFHGFLDLRPPSWVPDDRLVPIEVEDVVRRGSDAGRRDH